MNEFEVFLFDSEWDFEFCWTSKKTYGTINPGKSLVKINIRLMLIETLYHEFYHTKYPSFDESAIERMAQTKVQSLSVNEIIRITDKFVAYWGKGGE